VSNTDSNPIQALAKWFDQHRSELESSGVTAGIEHARADSPKAAAWVDLATATGIGRLTVWETGECEIQVAEIESGDVRTEHQDLQSDSELVEALDALVRGIV
jgi:hypothetical protein